MSHLCSCRHCKFLNETWHSTVGYAHKNNKTLVYIRMPHPKGNSVDPEYKRRAGKLKLSTQSTSSFWNSCDLLSNHISFSSPWVSDNQSENLGSKQWQSSQQPPLARGLFSSNESTAVICIARGSGIEAPAEASFWTTWEEEEEEEGEEVEWSCQGLIHHRRNRRTHHSGACRSCVPLPLHSLHNQSSVQPPPPQYNSPSTVS